MRGNSATGVLCMRGKSSTGALCMKGKSVDALFLRRKSANPPRGGKRARGEFKLNALYPGKLWGLGTRLTHGSS